MMAAAGNIEKEPQSVSAGSTGSGGKYDAPSGPYGVSTLICYDSPDSNWRFAWCFVMPYVGSNSCEARIVDNDTSINQSLFDSMDGSDVTATSQSDMIVDGTKYTFTVRLSLSIAPSHCSGFVQSQISCSIGGGTTPTADFYINYVAA